MTDRNLRFWAVIGFGVTSLLLVVTFAVGGMHIFERTYAVRAEFASADDVTSGDPVRVAGVEVGTVSSVARASDGIVMTLRLRREVRLSAATRATIRLRTLLGKKFVELSDPGTQGRLAPGATIGRARTATATDVDTLLNAAKPAISRVDLDSLNGAVRAVDKSLSGRGRDLRGLLGDLDRLATQLADRKADLDRLLVATDRLSGAVDDREQALAGSLDNFTVVLDTLAARRSELTALVGGVKDVSAQLTPLLHRNQEKVDTIVGDVLTTVRVLDGQRDRLNLALDHLPKVTDAFVRTTSQGSWVNVYIVGIGATPYLSNPVDLGDGRGLEPGRDGGLPRLWLQPPASVPTTEAGGVTVDGGDHSPPKPQGYPGA